jgi:two-component system sensor histidine kinase YesM
VYENFDKPLSLDILGEAVHLHPAYLSKIFKEETNINLSNYITDIRMQKAAELLEQTGLKVNEIMYLTGYRKSQHFTKLFKEKFGVTPMEYRRKKQISTVE